MKLLLTLLLLFVFLRQGFSQDSKEYKYEYPFSYHPRKYSNAACKDSLPISSIRLRFQIVSKRKLSKKKIAAIIKCFGERTSANLNVCDKKDEFYIEGLL